MSEKEERPTEQSNGSLSLSFTAGNKNYGFPAFRIRMYFFLIQIYNIKTQPYQLQVHPLETEECHPQESGEGPILLLPHLLGLMLEKRAGLERRDQIGHVPNKGSSKSNHAPLKAPIRSEI